MPIMTSEKLTYSKMFWIELFYSTIPNYSWSYMIKNKQTQKSMKLSCLRNWKLNFGISVISHIMLQLKSGHTNSTPTQVFLMICLIKPLLRNVWACDSAWLTSLSLHIFPVGIWWICVVQIHRCTLCSDFFLNPTVADFNLFILSQCMIF